MHLTKLIVSDFRNINHVELQLAPQVNVIIGDNGSGKTSLLEAVYFLGHAKSFRTLHTAQLITWQKKAFVLFGELSSTLTIGIERSQNNETIKLAKQTCQKKSELAKALPIQIINPDVHKILEDSPRYRRRFLDWGVFHVEHSYLDHWRRFQNILKQRNAALKQRWDKKLIHSWNDELGDTVNAITNIKTRYVEELRRNLDSIPHGFDGLDITYQRGWNESLSFEDSLQNSFEGDCKTGFTKFGPHRSDLKITVHGIAAKEVVSRGQQKYLACVMKIVQVEMFRKTMGYAPVFLVDDLFSELDNNFSRQVVDLLLCTNSQLLITAIDAQSVLTALPVEHRKMFHVKHGKFGEMV